MSHVWIVLCLLVQGTRSFMIYHALHGLCLQGSRENDLVHMNRCDLDSNLQQWYWEDHYFLVNKGTKRCLSSHQVNSVLTAPCDASNRLWWDCHSNQLVNHYSSQKLTTNGRSLLLSQDTKLSKWRSLGEDTICQGSLRPKRLSDQPDVLPTEDYDNEEEEVLTKDQKYLRWYYRTEDSSVWKYVMLVLSSGTLLLGCLLFGMGSLASWKRKKISQYKVAAAAATTGQELQSTAVFKQAGGTSSQHSQLDDKPPLDHCETGELRAGDIILKWKDGNVSTLYADAPEDDV